MEETSFISGQINRIGGQGKSPGNTYYPYTQAQKSKPQFTKVRAGEIVQGRIVKITGYQTALVRLPIGNFHAEIHGKLKAGDELFFYVMETQPNLIMRVYSVSIYHANTRRGIDEILRILDLPHSKEFLKTTEIAAKFNHMIIRDEIYSILRTYASIDSEQLEGFDFETAIETLWLMKESNIEFDEDIFANGLSFLGGVKSLNADLRFIFSFGTINSISKLHKDLSNYDSSTARLKVIFQKLRDIEATIDAIKSDFKKSKTIDPNIHDEFTKRIERIRTLFVSMNYWNTIALHNEIPMNILLPMALDNEIKIIYLTFKFKPETAKQIRHLGKSSKSDESTNIYAIFENLLSKNDKAKNNKQTLEIEYSLEPKILEIVNVLYHLPIVILKLVLLNQDEMLILKSDFFQSMRMKNISVVL
ncbi:MAG: hypothetical protein M9949_12370 [Candidatus Kapabacteria bacterium]|nr:hypothetical protein [Candidatus Kapabacteria bacterium]